MSSMMKRAMVCKAVMAVALVVGCGQSHAVEVEGVTATHMEAPCVETTAEDGSTVWLAEFEVPGRVHLAQASACGLWREDGTGRSPSSMRLDCEDRPASNEGNVVWVACGAGGPHTTDWHFNVVRATVFHTVD